MSEGTILEIAALVIMPRMRDEERQNTVIRMICNSRLDSVVAWGLNSF